MASIKLKFRTSSVQEKEGRLYYQVIHNRVARQIHTEYRIYSSEWDADHSNIILPTSVTPQRQAYLLSLKDTLDADRKKLLLVIARLDKEGHSYTADTVVDNFHEGKELHGIIGYTLELNEKLRRIGKKRMVARYKTTLNSLQRYLKGGDVPLEEVDGTTIQGYEQWLKDSGLCRNTTSFYIRNLRTIYNHAVDDGLVISSSPFKHVYTGIDKTVKRALPLEIIKQLKELDLSLNPFGACKGYVPVQFLYPWDVVHRYGTTYTKQSAWQYAHLPPSEDLSTVAHQMGTCHAGDSGEVQNR